LPVQKRPLFYAASSTANQAGKETATRHNPGVGIMWCGVCSAATGYWQKNYMFVGNGRGGEAMDGDHLFGFTDLQGARRQFPRIPGRRCRASSITTPTASASCCPTNGLRLVNPRTPHSSSRPGRKTRRGTLDAHAGKCKQGSYLPQRRHDLA